MRIAVAFMLGAGLVRANLGSSNDECSSDGQPKNAVWLIQTNLQTNVLKHAAEDSLWTGMADRSSLEASGSQAEQTCRSYFEKVYPMAGRTIGKYSDQQILDLLSGLTMYYEPLPHILKEVPFMIRPNKSFPSAKMSEGTKMRNVFGSLFQNAAGERVTFQTVGALAQHERSVFDSMDWSTPRSSWPAWIRESVLDEEAQIEVAHFAGSSHHVLAGVPNPANFLDSCRFATAWYYIRRGSGIFYAAGRTKTAVNKNHMLLLLIHEFESQHSGRVETFQTLFQGFDISALKVSLDATLSGTPCSSVKLVCWNDWDLTDNPYDELIIWLARECAYDTLVFAASPIDTKTQVMELVDLRWPVEAWLTDAQQRRYHPRDVVAKEWQRSMHSEMILTIRDPFQPSCIAGVLPCQFQLDSHQLYCQGTMSENVRYKGHQ